MHRVLIVEDHPVNATLLQAMVKRLGLLSDSVASGEGAVLSTAAAFRSGKGFSAVLMDINLPDITGVEACELIHGTLGVDAPPVIGVTAMASADDSRRCLQAGMAAFVPKPIEMLRLHEALCGVGVASVFGPSNSPLLDQQTVELTEQSLSRSVIDHRRIAILLQSITPDGDGAGSVGTLINAFLARFPIEFKAMETACISGNLQELITLSHRQRGAAAAVGAIELERRLNRMEARCRNGHPPTLVEFSQLHEMFKATQDAFSKLSLASSMRLSDLDRQ